MDAKKLFALVIASLVSTIPAILPVLGATAADITVSATVDPYISITFNYASVSFGSLDVSSGAVTDQQASPVSTLGYYNATIDTNKNYKLTANASAMTESGGGSLSVGDLSVDSDWVKGSLSTVNDVDMTGGNDEIDTDVGYGNTTHFHGYWLDAPQSQKAGSYSGAVTQTYASV